MILLPVDSSNCFCQKITSCDTIIHVHNLPGPLFPLLGLYNCIPDCLRSPYPYTVQLQACMLAVNPQLHVPQELLGITTPLVLYQWQQRLFTQHSDKQISALGIQFGFRIGFNYMYQTQQLIYKPHKKNLGSAIEHLHFSLVTASFPGLALAWE